MPLKPIVFAYWLKFVPSETMEPHNLSSALIIGWLGPDDNAEHIMGDNIDINIKSTLPLTIIHTLYTVGKFFYVFMLYVMMH